MRTVLAAIAVGLASLASTIALPKKGITLPNYVKTCRRDQPEFDSCILSSLQKLLPYLIKGARELDLPPLDPFKGDELVTEYVNGHVEGQIAIRDYVAYGLAALQFLDVRSDFSDPDDLRLQIDVFIPKLVSEGRYKIRGKFIGREMGSRGNYKISMSNITATWDIRGETESIYDIRYFKIKKFDVNPEVEELKVSASDLFPGNEQLTKTVLELFNQSWRLVYGELLPYARESWDKLMRGLAHRVFLRVPFDTLFPVSL